MKENARPTPSAPHTNPSSFFTLVTGWMQQGVESFFATQRILVDLAMRQNINMMKTLRDDFSSPETSPVTLMTELAAEGTTTFIEAQRILLELAQIETDIMMNGVKERVSGSAPAVAMTDMVRRSVGTFLTMQQDFLKMATKQTNHWLHAVKSGKGYDGDVMIEMAKEAMDHFVHAQKKFLDVIEEETQRVMSDKAAKNGAIKKTELSKLAREAANAFLDAQKKLLDVAGQHMNTNLQVAGRAMKMLKPLRLPLASLTGEGVKNFVDAEKALIDNMMKRNRPMPTPRPKGRRKPARKTSKPMTQAAKAGA
jgi:hypothetical protein